MYLVLRNLLSIALVAVLAGCAQSPTIKEQPSTEFGAQGLHPVQSSGFEAAYARPDAALASYRAVDIEALDAANVEFVRTVVSGTSRRDWEMTDQREANLQAAWARSMNRVFSSYDRSGSADKTLRISASLTRVEPGRSSSTSVGISGASTMGSSESVDISMEFRMYDVASGDLLVVIRDRRTAGLATWSRAAGVDMLNLFNSWSALLHTRVSGN